MKLPQKVKNEKHFKKKKRQKNNKKFEIQRAVQWLFDIWHAFSIVPMLDFRMFCCEGRTATEMKGNCYILLTSIFKWLLFTIIYLVGINHSLEQSYGLKDGL